MKEQDRLRQNLMSLKGYYGETYKSIAAGISRGVSTVSEDFNGRAKNRKAKEISPEIIKKYAKYFHVTTDMLLFGDCTVINNEEFDAIFAFYRLLLPKNRCFQLFPPKNAE